MEKIKFKMISKKFLLIMFFFTTFFVKIVSAEAYFDLSENNIKIETDFNGKEIIIFGILYEDQDTLITIKGPEKNALIQKKERILGFWFNTKQITYNKIPSIFFIASSGRPGPVLIDIPKDILNQKSDWVEPGPLDLPGYKPTLEPNPKMIQQAANLIKNSNLFKSPYFSLIGNLGSS